LCGGATGDAVGDIDRAFAAVLFDSFRSHSEGQVLIFALCWGGREYSADRRIV